ncbi:hypothetical protein AAGG74_14545 [Bacillus mexicanus]|uniref:hypothetical protein n=1 Tax=Bacillus mexicanus TaxID=2834415 RepID=UPI003D194221
MIRIQDCMFENKKYKVLLSEKTYKTTLNSGLHNGVFLSAATKTLNNSNSSINTYFNSEHNILLTIEINRKDKEVIFVDLKRLNIFDTRYLFPLNEAITGINKPIFLKSYEDGRKIFLNEGLPSKLSKLRIQPHLIAMKNINVPAGNHSMYLNEIIIDFKYTEEGEYYIVDLLKPNFVNFGLALLQN